ncbi:MAG: hypothetical protein KDE14_11090, partial [Rhodobacteraceae bacterium]|nr:hypothetical protein [Paracoccaceae bacterium]
RISWRVLPGADAVTAMVAAGEAGTILGFDSPPARVTARGHSFTVRVVANVTRPPLDKREVRHALAMAIDRSAMIKALDLRGARPAFSLVPPDFVDGYSGPRAPYAKLDQEDRVTIAGALLLDLDATPVDVGLAIVNDDIFREIAEKIAGDLAPLGFRVSPIAESADAHERRLIAGDFDLAISASAPADAYQYLFPFSQTAIPWNVGRYSDIAFDENLTASDTERDPGWQTEKLRQADEILNQDQAVWPLMSVKPEANFLAHQLAIFPRASVSKRTAR